MATQYDELITKITIDEMIAHYCKNDITRYQYLQINTTSFQKKVIEEKHWSCFDKKLNEQLQYIIDYSSDGYLKSNSILYLFLDGNLYMGYSLVHRIPIVVSGINALLSNYLNQEYFEILELKPILNDIYKNYKCFITDKNIHQLFHRDNILKKL